MTATSLALHLQYKNESMRSSTTADLPTPIVWSTNNETVNHHKLKERYIPHIRLKDPEELRQVYEFGEKIGEGGFGIVLSVMERTNPPKKWAMKCVAKTKAGDNLRLLRREIKILKLIRHPHIIYLDRIYETSQKMYMIFEKCHDALSDVYKAKKPFAETIVKKLTKELVEAVVYLHKYDIVHRDLKLENILLGDNPADPQDEYYVKLTDFGLSIVKYGKGIESMLHDFCGTLMYMAPEMITSRSYSQQCDNWAIGVIIYMLAIGDYPFFSKFEKDLQKQICNANPSFRTKNILTKEIVDLIGSLLMKDPANRLTATEVLQHPWILDKSMSERVASCNILQMMKEWRSEMTVPGIASFTQNLMSPENDGVDLVGNKQVLPLAKTEIKFDRSAKGSCSKPRSSLCSTNHLAQRSILNGQLSSGEKHSTSTVVK